MMAKSWPGRNSNPNKKSQRGERKRREEGEGKRRD